MRKTGFFETTNGSGKAARIEFLKQKLEEDRAALAAAMVEKARREKRDREKLEAIIGAAVRKTGADSPDFQRMIAQTALANVTDDKQRRFLADRGWIEQGR